MSFLKYYSDDTSPSCHNMSPHTTVPENASVFAVFSSFTIIFYLLCNLQLQDYTHTMYTEDGLYNEVNKIPSPR